jgi:hypothetical protein
VCNAIAHSEQACEIVLEQRAQKLMFSCLTSLLQFLVALLCRLRIFTRFRHYVGADNRLTRRTQVVDSEMRRSLFTGEFYFQYFVNNMWKIQI